MATAPSTTTFTLTEADGTAVDITTDNDGTVVFEKIEPSLNFQSTDRNKNLKGAPVVLVDKELVGENAPNAMDSARITGGSNMKILFSHVLPNVAPLALLFMVFSVTGAIASESVLSFLGLLNIFSVSNTVSEEIKEATLVSSRRWSLKHSSNIIIELPGQRDQHNTLLFYRGTLNSAPYSLSL